MICIAGIVVCRSLLTYGGKGYAEDAGEAVGVSATASCFANKHACFAKYREHDYGAVEV